MKNKHYKQRKKNEKLYEKMEKLMIEASKLENEEEIEKIMPKNLTKEEISIMNEIDRKYRLQLLFDDLGIDEKKLEDAKKKIIKLSPKSKEFKLISFIYKNHHGYYRLEDLFNEYHDTTLKDGMILGNKYGTKFIIEDLQNNRFTIEDIKNMTEKEIQEYHEEIREEI